MTFKQTIPIQTWKPDPNKPGTVVPERRRTVGEILADLRPILQAEFPELEWFGFGAGVELAVYQTHRDADWRTVDAAKHAFVFPSCAAVACYVVHGGSEGYLVRVDAMTACGRDGKAQSTPIFHGKFFDLDAAWRCARRLAGLLEA